ncbi:hypothetical protein HFC70_07965 [Agrobacterium sp. a22-2]|uniref:hypothetical protein n=1 Tax=Agrobacterium sp. a22-2 TaxID=2283840 RepID=UPI0014452CCB|nr:hypothetical protein [Agrobacterium sp. a22-2]NKN36293.1 hypothetical protein [Agrobacterium sp. a22-2]
MKIFAAATLIAALTGSSAAFAIEPIQGSITYGGHQSYLEKAPVGSNFFHTFTGQDGNKVREVYKVNADRSVSLVSRTVANS